MVFEQVITVDTTIAIQIGVAWADIVIDMLWHNLPYFVISLLVGMFVGIKYYKYSSKKR